MHEQNEQLGRTIETLDEQGLLLKEASVQLRAFARRMASGSEASLSLSLSLL